jgi:hypothetical protein
VSGLYFEIIAFMPASTSLSQCSTGRLSFFAPACMGLIGLTNSMRSPSALYMATMSEFWSNSTRSMFSKIFFRCFCTAVTSCVCDRICSSESLSRK